MKILLFLFMLLFSSCEDRLTKEICISFPQRHFWEAEYEEDMWYTLEYYDGKKVDRLTIAKGIREVKVEVYYNSNIIILAHPLGKLSPLGGVLTPGEKQVRLSLESGEFVSLLMDSIKYNENQVRYIDYEKAIEKLPSNYDLDKVYLSLLEGEFGKKEIKNEEYQTITLDALPKGKYIPENDIDPVFYITNDNEVTLKLKMGTHRYAHFGGVFYYLISINSTSRAGIQTLKMPLW